MARPIEYDLNKVLDNAMYLFWKKGYTGVSMADLVEHTGLNRRTMYSLFIDKEGIFKDALHHYYAKLSVHKLTVLKENPGKKGIEMFVKSFKFQGDFKGCLFSNSIREKDFLHADTFNIPKEYFNVITKQIEINLMQAVEKKEFGGDPKAMSMTIMMLIHGFHVYGKYNDSEEDSNAIFKNLLEMIQ
jgi:TetR/AcrR family transcriptional repressor of nem operon